MFQKQIKVNGEYVKGTIKDGVLYTENLITFKFRNPPNATKSLKSHEIQSINEELQMVKKEMEN